ncbi:MAG: DUF3810 domain-containing protein [Flavobacteriales bacterium]
MFLLKNILYGKIQWGIALFVLQIIVVQSITCFPDFVTMYYTEKWYPWISSWQRILFGSLLGVGDLMYAFLGIIFLGMFISLIKNQFRNSRKILCRLLIFWNLFYFSFYVLWGFNYYKQPFLEQFGIQKEAGTEKDLFELTEFMIQKTNQLREKANEDEKGVFLNKGSFDDTVEQVKKSYDNLVEKLHLESYKVKPIHKSWYSEFISYLGIGGYYNPFFGIAQINRAILPHDYGMTISHEIAHQYGFASEKEANYIAFLNGINSTDQDIQYSVCYNTVYRLLFEVYTVDFDRFEKYKAMLSEKVQKDRLADKKHYEKYRGELSDAFSKANSLYLKANGQEGIDTYSYYIQLVLNQYLAEKRKRSWLPSLK